MLTRRQATHFLGTTAFASIAGLELMPGPARAADPAPADLAMPGPLGDVWLGSPDAKCTIIEYASMTCTPLRRFSPGYLAEAEIDLYRHRQGAFHLA